MAGRCDPERLSELLDGELPVAEREALARHVEACPECRRALAALRRVSGLVRALPAARAPRGFLPRVMARVSTIEPGAADRTSPRSSRAGREGLRLRWSFWSSAATAAAACLLLALVGAVAFRAGDPGKTRAGRSRAPAPREGSARPSPAILAAPAAREAEPARPASPPEAPEVPAPPLAPAPAAGETARGASVEAPGPAREPISPPEEGARAEELSGVATTEGFAVPALPAFLPPPPPPPPPSPPPLIPEAPAEEAVLDATLEANRVVGEARDARDFAGESAPAEARAPEESEKSPSPPGMSPSDVGGPKNAPDLLAELLGPEAKGNTLGTAPAAAAPAPAADRGEAGDVQAFAARERAPTAARPAAPGAVAPEVGMAAVPAPPRASRTRPQARSVTAPAPGSEKTDADAAKEMAKAAPAAPAPAPVPAIVLEAASLQEGRTALLALARRLGGRVEGTGEAGGAARYVVAIPAGRAKEFRASLPRLGQAPAEAAVAQAAPVAPAAPAALAPPPPAARPESVGAGVAAVPAPPPAPGAGGAGAGAPEASPKAGTFVTFVVEVREASARE